MNESHAIYSNDGKVEKIGTSYSTYNLTSLPSDKIIFLRDISNETYQIYREKGYWFVKRDKKLISARGLWQKTINLTETMRLSWDKKTSQIIEIVEIDSLL